jgi:hypothetical protein
MIYSSWSSDVSVGGSGMLRNDATFHISDANKHEAKDLCHYHIRWSSSALDWEAFFSEHDADDSAKKLVRPGETYTIEQFNGDCPKCAALLVRPSGSTE